MSPPTLAPTRPTGPPRVNLLPPEIGRRRRFRRLQAGAAAGVLTAAGAVAVMYVVVGGQVADAETELDAVRAEQARLQQQAARYAQVPLVEAQVDQAEATSRLALQQQVAWSGYLGALARTVPDRVWLTGMTAAVGEAQAGAAGTTSTPDALGSAELTGYAFSHDDVATLLTALAAQQGNRAPSFSRSARKEAAGTEVVEFAASVELTPQVLTSVPAAEGG